MDNAATQARTPPLTSFHAAFLLFLPGRSAVLSSASCPSCLVVVSAFSWISSSSPSTRAALSIMPPPSVTTGSVSTNDGWRLLSGGRDSDMAGSVGGKSDVWLIGKGGSSSTSTNGTAITWIRQQRRRESDKSIPQANVPQSDRLRSTSVDRRPRRLSGSETTTTERCWCQPGTRTTASLCRMCTLYDGHCRHGTDQRRPTEPPFQSLYPERDLTSIAGLQGDGS